MADRTETLLFLIDVQVNNARALRQLDTELDAAFAARERRLTSLSQIAGATPGTGPAAGASPSHGEGQIVGVRGPVRPGSRSNPVTMVAESGQAAGLGALAAATGAQSADTGPPKVVPTEPSAGPNGGVVAALNGAAALRQALNGGNGSVLAVPSGGSRAPVRVIGTTGTAGGGGDQGGPPVRVAVGGGGGGGGRGILSRLGWGAGFAGAAGFGSALSFAGLDFTHLLTTGLGVAGSAAGAGIGGGLLGLGSLGKLLAGGGSDALAFKTTLTNVKALSTALDNLQQAQAIYGKNSTQASVAQRQLNFQMAQAGPAAASALSVAKNASALTDMWRKASAGAQQQAASIMNQVIAVGTSFVPLIAAAAQRNLTIINNGVKPLFAWLQGPQGIQIFNDLENAFAKQLPAAVHAGSQAFELLLRVMDIASSFTGGFVTHLDHLFTRLNSLDNAQLGAVISRYVADFRLWDHFIKLLVEDIYLLFHQDVGTGNAIIATLTAMLVHLHVYETSARGSAQIQSIFMIHKTEVLALLHILGSLISTFTQVYLAVAPALVAAMNNVVLPVIKVVADVLSSIARTSPFAATLIGLGLIASKAGGVMATANAVKSLVLWLTGAKTASEALSGPGLLKGAAGAGAAAAGGAEAAARGGGVASVLGTALGGSVATALRVAFPALAALLAADFVLKVTHASSPATLHVTPSTPPGKVQVPELGFHSSLPVIGPAANAVANLLGFNTGTTLDIRKIGDFSNYSAKQLVVLIAAMQQASGVKVNGITEAKNQVIALALAALKVKNDWNQAFTSAFDDVNQFYRNTSRTLPALVDDFQSNMRLIASTMGVNSTEGRKLVAENVTKMVAAVSAGMLSGRISARDGIAAITKALNVGLKDGAITWHTEWRAMFKTVTGLYAHHKIDTKSYLADLRQINQTAVGHIKSDTEASYQKTFANLKHQYDRGLITKKQFDTQAHEAQVSANSQYRHDLEAYAGNVFSAMFASGSVTLSGARAVVKELNQVLGPLGAAKIPLPSAVSVAVGNAVGPPTSAVNQFFSGGFAVGGKVDRPMYMVGEEAPQHPEYVVATNPAYRQRNVGLWAAAGRDLGVPGFARGGVVTASEFGGPSDPGTGSVGYRGDNLYAHPDSYAELNMGTALGNLPYLSPLDVTYAGRTARLRKRDIGAGGPGLGGHTRALDLWFQAAQALGFPGLADVLVGGGGGVNVHISGSGQIQSISAPHVKGGGALGHMVQAALNKLAQSANAYAAKHTPSVNTSVGVTGGSPFHHGHFTFPLPQGSWSAGAVDQGWDLSAPAHTPEFALGAGTIVGHGIGGFGPWAPILRLDDGTEVYYGHAGPGGELPVGTHVRAGQVLGEVGAGIVGISTGPHLEIGFYPPGGMGRGAAMKASLGYARGGVIGRPSAEAARLARHPGHHPHKPKHVKGLHRHRHVLGKGGQFPFSTGDYESINRTLAGVLALDGTAAGSGSTGGAALKLSDLIGFYTNLWSSSEYPPSVPSAADTFASWASPGSFVISTDAKGQAVTPYVSPNLPQVSGELGQAIGWQAGIVGDLRAALGGSEGAQGQIAAAIKRRVAEVKRIKDRVQANIAKIKALQKQIKDERAKHAPYRHPRGAAQRAANAAFENARKAKIAGWTKQIAALEAENMKLTGGKDAIPSTPGGELGMIDAQLGAPQSGDAIAQALGTGTAASGLYALSDTVSGWVTGLGGPTGDIATQLEQLTQYQLGLAGLDPAGAALANALAAAASTTTGSQSPLSGSTAFTYQGQTFLAGMAKGGVLQNQTGPLAALSVLPPFAGSFHQGGVVPGPDGAERTARVRSGEVIGWPSAGSGGGAGSTAALDRNTAALCAHQASVEKLIDATERNTTVTQNQTGTRQAGYTQRNPYSSHLSSDDVSAIGLI